MSIIYTFEQSTGKVYDVSGKLVTEAYSGNGPDKNNPASEGKLGHGPIPVGLYSIEGPPYDSPTHGPYVMHLIPDKDTKAHILDLGRQPYTFLWHGDKIGAPGTASDGCVVSDRMTREKVWSTAEKTTDPLLQVVATYGG